MRFLTQLSRILVGALFIFSGLIKANDPLGFSYKLNEYFEVFGTDWLVPFSLFISIFMCALEMLLGILLLIGARIKLTLWLLLLMILFFASLNFYSGYYDKVHECGCFGDAIKMTPWQEFRNNMIMLVMTIFMLIRHNDIRSLFGMKMENAFVFLSIIASLGFPLYTYNYLPIIDFRPYKIGTNIYEAIHPQVKYYYTLKNKKTGEVKDFDAWPPNWDKEWDYVSNRAEPLKKGITQIVGFSMENRSGEDYTDTFLQNPKYSFLLVEYDLDKANRGVQGRINDFSALCQKDGMEFIGLTTSTPEKINEFKNEAHSMYYFYRCPDDVPLKTMIRSNPGLILFKAGVVIDMWHFHSFPSYNDIKEKYFK